MLGGFDGGDIARQAQQGRSKSATRFSVDPPVVAIGRPCVLVAFGLHGVEKVLVDLGEARTHALHVQSKQVDDENAARLVGKVAPIPIRSDMRIQSLDAAEPEFGGLRGRDDESRAMQLESGATDVAIGLQGLGGSDIGAAAQIGMDQTTALAQRHGDLILSGFDFAFDDAQLSFDAARRAHRHRDAYGRAVRRIHPGMIGNGEH